MLRRKEYTTVEGKATTANLDTPGKDLDLKIVKVNEAVKSPGSSDVVPVEAEDPKV